MNICYYSNSSDYGGAEKYLETLAIGCVENGFNCAVILRRDNIRFQESLHRSNLRWYKVNGFRDLFKKLKKIKPDFFHINLPGPWGAHGVATLSKIAGVKNIITTEHLPMFGPSIRHSPLKHLDTIFIDRVITVSYENKPYLEIIHKIKPEKISVVHNGIDTDLFDVTNVSKSPVNFRERYKIASEDFVYGIVGRITEQKGHKIALKSFSQMVKKHDDVKLMIIGDGELQKEMIDIAQRKGIDSKVIFAGFQKDMPAVYAALNVLLMPSTFEALPLTLLEAMSMGIPAIASRINGIPEVIENEKNGFLIPPQKWESLFLKMEQLYHDPGLTYSLSKASIKKIRKNFSIKQMVSNTISIYRELSRT